MASYITVYIDPIEIIYTSKKIRNYTLAENILFIKLNEYRIKRSREFFDCESEIIKREMDNINEIFDKYTDEEIYQKMIPKKEKVYTISEIINAENITKETYEKTMLMNKKTDDENRSIIKYERAESLKIKMEDINESNMEEYNKKKYSVEKNKKIIEILYNGKINDVTTRLENISEKELILIKKILLHFGYNKKEASITREELITRWQTLDTIINKNDEIVLSVTMNKNIKKSIKSLITSKQIIAYLSTIICEYGISIKSYRTSTYNKITKKKQKNIFYKINNKNEN